MNTLIGTLHRRLWQSKLVFTSLLVLGLTLATVMPTQTAQAAGCREYDTVVGVNQFALDWYVTGKTTVPSWSGCADINLTRESISYLYGSNTCANFRVRFYPSSGGSKVTTPKLACTGYGSLELATSVKNGTVYRIEVDTQVRFHIFD